ncbi:integrase, catalytic region, zinc finger, CCHC-type containing protein [Tanacetum coccineum]
MGTTRFRNDQFVAITGYGDYVHGNITICHVYYVEGLGHNLFSVEGDDLLKGARESNLYMISISDMAASSPVCLMSKATSTKSWLWHQRLSHLKFGTINHLTKQELVDGLTKFKYDKDHLCSACEQRKSRKATLPPKLVPSTHSKMELIHMDLCGPMRVESINGKKYILVIVDDYSRYTWIQKVQADNRNEFKNATLQAHYEKDLDNLYGLMYKEYFEMRSPEVSINSAAQTTLNNEDTPSSSSIIVEDNEAPPFVSSLEEQISPISTDDVVESVQEDSANLLLTPYNSLMFEEADSSSNT